MMSGEEVANMSGERAGDTDSSARDNSRRAGNSQLAFLYTTVEVRDHKMYHFFRNS